MFQQYDFWHNVAIKLDTALKYQLEYFSINIHSWIKCPFLIIRDQLLYPHYSIQHLQLFRCVFVVEILSMNILSHNSQDQFNTIILINVVV